jgi:hypothetical protein
VSTYLDLDEFKGLTVMPSLYVDEVEKKYPGWVDKQLDIKSRWIDSRLRKNYASPFAAFTDDPPTPLTVQNWLQLIVTREVWLKRGVNASDEQFALVAQRAETAEAEVLEAANSEDGWFDIPRRVDADGTLMARTQTQAYSEQSPYVWTDKQVTTANSEDKSGTGTNYG